MLVRKPDEQASLAVFGIIAQSALPKTLPSRGQAQDAAGAAEAG